MRTTSFRNGIRKAMDSTQQGRLAAWQAWGILGLLSLIWGTSYVLIKWGLLYFPPVQVAGIRLGVSALAFSPILVRELRKIKREQLPLLFLVGIMGTGLPAFLFPAAQEYVSSSLAGILNSLTPLFTLSLGIVFFNTSFTWTKTLGILIGLVGAIFLFAFGEDAGLGGKWTYGLLIVLACLCYASSSNIVGFKLRSLNGLTISAVSFSLVGIPVLLYLLLGTDFINTLQAQPEAWKGVGYITVLALFSTVLAGIIFFQLIQWTSPVFGSTVSYLVPAVAMGWGALDGEVIALVHFAGMGLILAGVYLSKN
ncbi:MAG: EamA family transporter [Bacteroidota bacterium]